MNISTNLLNSLVKLLLSIILITILWSCNKDKTNQNIPYVFVNESIYTNTPEFVNLNPVGGWTYITGGSRGIIIYRESTDNFRAFDRHCPYDPANTCGLVSVDITNITGVDNCCGSKFIITDGQVIQGPATVPLQEYAVTYDGNRIHITN